MHALRTEMPTDTWLRCFCETTTHLPSELTEAYVAAASGYLQQPETTSEMQNSIIRSKFGYAPIVAAFSISLQADIVVMKYPPSIDDGHGMYKFWSHGRAPTSMIEAAGSALCMSIVDLGGGKFQRTVPVSQDSAINK